MADDHQRYRIDECVRPGLIESWSGLDRTLDRPVTIRLLDPSSEVGKRVELQARALVRLEHPALLHVLDTIELGDRIGLVTETLPEENLAQHLTSKGTLSSEECLFVAIQLGEALAALHSAGFAIGELHAENIGKRLDGTVVVVDGPPTGDANKIPARPQDDIVSLGELIHECLVGFRPQLDHQGRHEIHPAISASFRQLIRRSVDRDDQWSDASALVLALRSLTQDFDRVADTVEVDQVQFLKAERSWLAPAGFVGILAAVVILVGLLVTRTQVGSSLVENVREAVRLEAQDPVIVEGFDSSPSVTSPVLSRPESSPTRLQIVSIVPFDPAGNDQMEHPEKINLINNGDSNTGWYTERYTTADFGKLKEGVGLIISLGPPQQLDRLRISSPTIDWSFEVFASENTGGVIQSWGEPVASRDEVSGTITVDLNDKPGATLLLWITSLGRELAAGGHRVTVTEVSITGRPKYG
tara:strand:- start:9226 stop:10638 length:1413 start_codon:yes stop_codon:yes gene_type:complete